MRRSRSGCYCSRLSSRAACEPDHGSVDPAAPHSVAGRALGPALRRRPVHRCHAVLQLFLPPSHRRAHHRRSAELACPACLSQHLCHRQPALRADSRRSAGGHATGTRSRSSVSGSAAAFSKPTASPNCCAPSRIQSRKSQALPLCFSISGKAANSTGLPARRPRAVCRSLKS